MGKFRDYLESLNNVNNVNENKGTFKKLSEKRDIKWVMCPNCNGQETIKIEGKDKNLGQYMCSNCKKGFKASYYDKNDKLIKI